MPRTIRARQRAELYVVDAVSGETRLVNRSGKRALEAPTWTPDGTALVVRAAGVLYRLPVDGSGELEEIPLLGVPSIGWHVLHPDGETVFVTPANGHIYRAKLTGGTAHRITNDHGPRVEHRVHGITADGAMLSYTGAKTKKDGRVNTDVFLLPATGGEDVRMTDDPIVDGGAELSPDGEWVYFCSERASSKPGHTQLFRMAMDRVVCEQLTDDKRVDWFPHPSPDGQRVAYLSYGKGTKGRPVDAEVIVRVLDPDGSKRDLVKVPGGHGTLDAPCWSPDSRYIAYVAYPAKGAEGKPAS